MRKKKIFIAVNSLEFGGIQKSLVDFILYLKEKAEIDILVWDKSDMSVILPDFVNMIEIQTVGSIRKVFQRNGIFSVKFLLSLLATFSKKRWNVMSSPKKKYDIAIAYSHVGLLKYYVIDKVLAKHKFAFYHHGAYTFNDKIRNLDIQYYKKYDIVFAVSQHVKDMLKNELSEDINLEVLPNLVNIEKIHELGLQNCLQMSKETRRKILTVGRLSEEKNIFKILEVCKELKQKDYRFHWYIVGDGPQKKDLESFIKEYSLEDVCTLCGSQSNPYKFMKKCDLYVQLSKYESQSITVQEVAIFDKPMILSKISAFENYTKYFPNILIVDGDASYIADCIISKPLLEFNNLDSVNQIQNNTRSIIDHFIFSE